MNAEEKRLICVLLLAGLAGALLLWLLIHLGLPFVPMFAKTFAGNVA